MRLSDSTCSSWCSALLSDCAVPDKSLRTRARVLPTPDSSGGAEERKQDEGTRRREGEREIMQRAQLSSWAFFPTSPPPKSRDDQEGVSGLFQEGGNWFPTSHLLSLGSGQASRDFNIGRRI